MEEPLLGSQWRPRAVVNRGLFQIPEETGSEEADTIPISPSSIKEKLIFGSPDVSPKSQYVWLDNSPSPEQSSNENEDEQPLIPSHNEDVCARGKSLNKPIKGKGFNKPINGFDDSFIDNRIIGSYRSEPRLSTDLTKLDLDVRARSPRYRSSPMAAWFLGEKEAAKRQAERDSANRSHTVAMPPDSPTRKTTMDDHTFTKRLLHRARTAPSLTVRPDKEKPHTTMGLSVLPTVSVVSQAFIGLLLYLTVGVLIYAWKEEQFSGSTTHYFIDAIYFCIVTMCTIGYGDIIPTTPAAKLFSCAFVLVGFGFIDILLSGMVSYVLDKQETLLLSAVAAGQHETAKNYLVDINKGRMRIRSKVTLAFGVVVMCIGVGTLVMHFIENMGWLDSFYLSCMSVTTVGYGDHAFKTMAGRLFASVWLLVSTLAVARSFLYLAEARIDKRHRLIAKLVLEKEMTIGDLLAADFDNDGCVSKSDFVVYKLKQMGKILEKDISEVCKQFSRLDTDNSGKISLSCLLNLHEASAALK